MSNNSDFEKTKRWVKLNVGGQLFITSRQTLLKEPNSFFHGLLSEGGDLDSDKDETGAYLIDRDPHYFGPVLNYLRCGCLIFDHSINISGIMLEAQFYNILTLVNLIKDKHLNNNAKSQQTLRVVQCKVQELTATLSGMSDGWKLNQLVNVGCPRGPDGCYDDVDILCVVSQDIEKSSEVLNIKHGTKLMNKIFGSINHYE